jgi:hypothetical protein
MFRLLELLAAAAGIVTAAVILWDRFMAAPFPVELDLVTSRLDAEPVGQGFCRTQCLLRMRSAAIGHLVVEEISAPGCLVEVPGANQETVHSGKFQKIARPNAPVRAEAGQIVEYIFLVRPTHWTEAGEAKLVTIRIVISFVGAKKVRRTYEIPSLVTV